MADKEIRININTKADGRGTEKAKRELDKLNQSIDQSTRASQKKAQADDITEDKIEDVEISAARLRRELDKATGLDPRVRKTVEGLADSMERAEAQGARFTASQVQQRKATGNSGLAVLELSRGIEDLQYGVYGVLNNIPQLLLHLGVTAGLAGVVSLAAVGISQLVTHLSEADEEIEGLSENMDDFNDRLREFHKELAEAGFEAYAQKLDLLDEKYDRENRKLKDNVSLLDLKRKAELDLAAAQDNLELAQIAARERSDPNYSGTKDRAEISRRQLLRNQQAKEEEVLSKIDQLTEKRNLDVQKIVEKEAQLNKLLEDRAKLEEREAELRTKKAEADRYLAKADKQDEDGEGGAQYTRQIAADIFGVALQQELASITETQLPGIKNLQGSLADQLIELRSSAQIQAEAINTAEEMAQLTVESSRKLTELNLTTLEVKANSKQADELAKDASETAKEILSTIDGGKLSAGTKQTLGQLERLITDDIDDRKQIDQIMAEYKNLQIQGATSTRELQMGVSTLIRKYDELSKENRNLMENLRRIESRR